MALVPANEGYLYMSTKKNVPVKAVIDEAVEIAKKYGCGDSSSFINGVLDRIAKETSCPPS